MARVIAIGNQKGGVCKTTTAATMGGALLLKGYKVLYVDCDPQADLTFSLGASQKGLTLLDVLKKSVPAGTAIQHTDNGDIIAACAEMASADKWLTDPKVLIMALKPLKKKYDFIIVDTPRALAMLAIIAFAAADDVIVTATADVYTINAILQMSDTISVVREDVSPTLRIAGILLCKQDARTNISREVEDILREKAKTLNTKVFKTTIRQAKHVREAALLQQGLFRYAPACNPALDYMDFVTEYLADKSK